MKGTRGDQARRTPLVGKAGEHAVASKLLLMGVVPAWPSVDEGYDLICSNGCKIQVKSGHMRTSPGVLRVYSEGVYSFHFPKTRHIATSKDSVRTADRKKFSEVCDVVVLWGIEQGRFWVVPSLMLDKVQCVFMGPKNARAFDSDIPGMREMMKLGFSQAEIGKQYGMSQAAVSHRLLATSQHSPNSAACTVRNCEDAWDNILDFPACKLYSVHELTKEATDAVELD